MVTRRLVRSGRGARPLALCALAGALTGVLPASGLRAQPRPALRLELNRLEPQGDSCRAYLLVDNRGGEALRSFKLDLFALDADGVAAKRLAVELGPVPEKKKMIKLFDFTGLACARFGSLLLNDVLACEGASGPIEGCLDGLETGSKAAAPFVK